jgi:Family of unknown function (DUF6088)
MLRTSSIATALQRQVQALPEGELLPIIPNNKSESAYFKALSRLARSGQLIRLEKGKYFKPKTSRFGPIRLPESEIIKALTQKGDKITGYLTGNSLYNRWALTTQVPNTLTIARRSRLPDKELSGYKVKFVVRPFPFKETDIPMMQLLDALTDIQKIPDTPPEKVVPVLAEKISNLQPLQISRMMKLALEYPPSTRALLGALLETYLPNQPTTSLRKSLNPLTKYKLKGIDIVLANNTKWNFYEAARRQNTIQGGNRSSRTIP